MPSKITEREGRVCLQLIRKRKVKLLRTRFRLFPTEWDDKQGIIFSDQLEAERQSYLQSVQSGLEAELAQLGELIRLLEKKSEYTVDELAELYTSRSLNGYFFPFVEYIVKNLKANQRTKTATILHTAKMSFEQFRCKRDILIDRIDNELILKYEVYLKSLNLKKNTISCYMRALRSAYNQAIKRGLSSQKHPFTNIFTRIDKTTKRAIGEKIITQIKNLDLSAHKELALARDLFMFSFYLRGISFVDMANLRKKNVKNGYIAYVRSKTKQILSVKIEPCMQKIISRYEFQTVEDYLLPVYTNFNRSNSSQLRNHNKRLKRISEIMGLEKPLSSYVSRHSWATIAFRKKVPVEIISKSMGHENESTTRIYLASLGQSVIDEANMEVISLV